ncbi:MAG: hypothetical protein NZ922_06770 [Candidatus Methanomethyliaceae archaeon]|nr:hypothetical protein [Candidatus Methanomethyliaceae archaeon]MDW7971141.1 hypothetical protein [Nitrososphaerota archaeon]
MIEWFDEIEALGLSSEEAEFLEKWVDDKKSELHDIYHFLREHKMEAFKIIRGEQYKSDDGSIIIKSFEIYIVYNAMFIVRSEEKQVYNTNDTVRTFTKLGIINICSSEDECYR